MLMVFSFPDPTGMSFHTCSQSCESVPCMGYEICGMKFFSNELIILALDSKQ